MVVPLSSKQYQHVKEKEEESSWAFLLDEAAIDSQDRGEKENADLSSWAINWGRSPTTTKEENETSESHISPIDNEQHRKKITQWGQPDGNTDEFERIMHFGRGENSESKMKSNDGDQPFLDTFRSWSSSTPSSNAVSIFLRELWEETISSVESSENSSVHEMTMTSKARSSFQKRDPPVHDAVYDEESDGASNDVEFSPKPSSAWPWRRRKEEHDTVGTGRLGISERIDVFDHTSGSRQCDQIYSNSKPVVRSRAQKNAIILTRGQKQARKAEIGEIHNQFSKGVSAGIRTTTSSSKQTKTFGSSFGIPTKPLDTGEDQFYKNQAEESINYMLGEQDEDVVFQKSVPIQEYEKMESHKSSDNDQKQGRSFLTYDDILESVRRKKATESKENGPFICDESDFYQSEEGSKASKLSRSDIIANSANTPQQPGLRSSTNEATEYGNNGFQKLEKQRLQQYDAIKKPEPTSMKRSSDRRLSHKTQETVVEENLSQNPSELNQSSLPPCKEHICDESDFYQSEEIANEFRIDSRHTVDTQCHPLKTPRRSTLRRMEEPSPKYRSEDDHVHFHSNDRISSKVDNVVHQNRHSLGQSKSRVAKDDTPAQFSIKQSISLFDDVGDEESSGASTRALHDGLSSFDPMPSGVTPMAAETAQPNFDDLPEQYSNETSADFQPASHIPAQPQQNPSSLPSYETQTPMPAYDGGDHAYYSNHSYIAQNMAALDEFRRKHFPMLFPAAPSRYPMTSTYQHEPPTNQQYASGAAGVPGYPNYRQNLRQPIYQSDSIRDYWETYASVQPLGSFDSISVGNGRPGPVAAAPGNNFYENPHIPGYRQEQMYPQYHESFFQNPPPTQHEGVYYEPMGIPQAPSNDSSTRRKVDESTAPFSPNERTIETMSTFSTIKKRKAARAQSRKNAREDAETVATDADDESQAGGHGCSLICGDYSFGVKGWLCP